MLLAVVFSPWGIPKGTPPPSPCGMGDVTLEDHNSSLSRLSLPPFVWAPELSKLTYPKSAVNYDHPGKCNLLQSLREALPSQKYFTRQFTSEKEQTLISRTMKKQNIYTKPRPDTKHDEILRGGYSGDRPAERKFSKPDYV